MTFFNKPKTRTNDSNANKDENLGFDLDNSGPNSEEDNSDIYEQLLGVNSPPCSQNRDNEENELRNKLEKERKTFKQLLRESNIGSISR